MSNWLARYALYTPRVLYYWARKRKLLSKIAGTRRKLDFVGRDVFFSPLSTDAKLNKQRIWDHALTGNLKRRDTGQAFELIYLLNELGLPDHVWWEPLRETLIYLAEYNQYPKVIYDLDYAGLRAKEIEALGFTIHHDFDLATAIIRAEDDLLRQIKL